MRDAGVCDARIKGSHMHTRREFLASLSSPTHNFHARSRSFMIRFQPKRHAKIPAVLQSRFVVLLYIYIVVSLCFLQFQFSRLNCSSKFSRKFNCIVGNNLSI